MYIGNNAKIHEFVKRHGGLTLLKSAGILNFIGVFINCFCESFYYISFFQNNSTENPFSIYPDSELYLQIIFIIITFTANCFILYGLLSLHKYYSGKKQKSKGLIIVLFGSLIDNLAVSSRIFLISLKINKEYTAINYIILSLLLVFSLIYVVSLCLIAKNSSSQCAQKTIGASAVVFSLTVLIAGTRLILSIFLVCATALVSLLLMFLSFLIGIGGYSLPDSDISAFLTEAFVSIFGRAIPNFLISISEMLFICIMGIYGYSFFITESKR